MNNMSYKRKVTDNVLDLAKTRYSAMEQIDVMQGREINYGGEQNPLNKGVFLRQIATFEEAIKEYNQYLEQADIKRNRVAEAKRNLALMHSSLLKGAVAEFGADADEVEMLGGTRISERKRPVRKKTK